MPWLQHLGNMPLVIGVLKGHGFSRAVQLRYFCHSERASAREESASPTISAGPFTAPPRAISVRPPLAPQHPPVTLVVDPAGVLPPSGQAAESFRRSSAILRQETSAVRSLATSFVRPD